MLIGLALVLAAWIAAGAVMVASAGTFTPSGTYVDIGGRKLRLVCAGRRRRTPDRLDGGGGVWPRR
jgi:hypothetical protein